MLGSHSPLPVQSSGKQAWQYFIPDGKYRMQVFALEDPGDGTLQIYLPDILDAAIKKKVIKKTPEPDQFIAVETGTKIRIDALDSANTPQPPPHFKHMLGWNRTVSRRCPERDSRRCPGAVSSRSTRSRDAWRSQPRSARPRSSTQCGRVAQAS